MDSVVGMASDSISDFLIDDGGGSDCELSRALQCFCDQPLASGLEIADAAYMDACAFDQNGLRKRAMEESPGRPKSKACREKMRRDRLNDRFVELSSVLDPGRPIKSDKASILSDAARTLVQLKREADELKESNEKLQETIKDLKAEKNELRDEKISLKAEKERLEQQLKAMSIPPTGFMPHPIAPYPVAAAPAFVSHGNAPGNKTAAAPFAAFPGVPMWQWLPPAVVDTTQDAKLWSPNA